MEYLENIWSRARLSASDAVTLYFAPVLGSRSSNGRKALVGTFLIATLIFGTAAIRVRSIARHEPAFPLGPAAAASVIWPSKTAQSPLGVPHDGVTFQLHDVIGSHQIFERVVIVLETDEQVVLEVSQDSPRAQQYVTVPRRGSYRWSGEAVALLRSHGGGVSARTLKGYGAIQVQDWTELQVRTFSVNPPRLQLIPVPAPDVAPQQ
jgi:hypothetical protein